ncbi:MAG TPA: M56 family metallopeptidase [Vicinamibacterales bacterium]|nr:M56 family metallopeptidase [Vicinamibacterales bacterium]
MIKVSAIVLVGLLATVLLRDRSAALRHWVLAAAVACAALTPVLEQVVPAWHPPILASWFTSRSEPLTLVMPLHYAQAAEAPGAVAPGGTGPAPAARVLVSLGWIWLAGTGVCLSLLLAGFARLGWIASRSRRVAEGTWFDVADSLSRRFGVTRPVLLESVHPTLLVTWGVRRPRVLFPRAAREWSADRVSVVLGHELAHIRRGDWAIQLLAELLRSVYWFNPLLWVACRRLRLESEQACDDVVLGMGVGAPEYATHLVDLARALTAHRQPLFPAPAMAHRSNLERRVRAMLNARLNRTPVTRSAFVLTVVALLGLTVPIAGLAGYSQNATASFSGFLVDGLGRGIPGVPIVLAGVETGLEQEARSDEAGRFTFADLPAGEYRLQVQKPGFATIKTRLTLAAGQNLRQDIALQIGSVRETIVVSGNPSNPVAAPVRKPHQPAPDPCDQSTAGGCITPPLKLVDVRPVYPMGHLAKGVNASVEVEGRIGTDGYVKDLRPTETADPDFVQAALAAIRQWQFAPTRLNGVPVETRIVITTRFASE